MTSINQCVSGEFCLSCLGCCRYSGNDSIWAPNLLAEEQQRLGIEEIGLIAYKNEYICSFLDSSSNYCQIYESRPLECRIYPFLLNRKDNKLYLSLHKSCPAISEQLNTEQIREYQKYLVEYLESTPVAVSLNDSFKGFGHYPDGEIIDLTELKIQ